MAVLNLPKRFSRPMPPADMRFEEFRPAPELEAWARAVFIEDGPLCNPDHEHLRQASIGCVWTTVENVRSMRRVVGQAELMPPMAMGKWQKARAVDQIAGWFDGLPDFMLTFDATAMREFDDASFCAVVEHELYHCAQLQEFGAPKFHLDGSPWFGMRGHDVEEFVGVVARYGAAATQVGDMVRAANAGPLIAGASVAAACGTCMKRRA